LFYDKLLCHAARTGSGPEIVSVIYRDYADSARSRKFAGAAENVFQSDCPHFADSLVDKEEQALRSRGAGILASETALRKI
jgi:hypothetical protein